MKKKIILYQFPGTKNIPNFSPFCMKLETYLRMTNRDYETVAMVNPRKSAMRGKLPFIKYDNEILGDSSLIISRLESDSDTPLDGHLNVEQQAERLCMQRMLEEHFYWIIVYSRWASKEGWPVWSQKIKKRLPPLIGNFILSRLKAGALNQLVSQGIGRFDEKTIFEMGIADLEALNIKMGERPWYFNNKPSTLDAIIYSFLASSLSAFWPFPIKDFVLSHSNMMNYYYQVQTYCFSELINPQA